MVDEREKSQPEAMDYVRKLLFGYADGKTLHSYWEKHNKSYWLIDLRAGVKVTPELLIQLMALKSCNLDFFFLFVFFLFGN